MTPSSTNAIPNNERRKVFYKNIVMMSIIGITDKHPNRNVLIIKSWFFFIGVSVY